MKRSPRAVMAIVTVLGVVACGRTKTVWCVLMALAVSANGTLNATTLQQDSLATQAPAATTTITDSQVEQV